MNDAALRLLDSLRDPDGAYPSPAALDAFARLLAGPAKPEAARRWTIAALAEAPRIRARADAFRAVYHAAEREGWRVDVVDPTNRHGALVLEGVFGLPPRERAILALSCVLGFTIGEVAHVIGGDPAAAHVELEQAVTVLRTKAEDVGSDVA
jgi:DNA-directed RNA polymerase specialized sigma24 family protein